MTRFIYLSDSHHGSTGRGFQQQRPYPERLPEIIAALAEWVRRDGRVNFVLHGGDMVDGGARAQIQQASDLFRLPVPVYLCLGNHDLTERESLENWLKFCPEYFLGGQSEYLIETDDCVIHVVPNHWGKAPKGQEDIPCPYFLPDQLAALDRQSVAAGGRPRILLTHSPVFGAPQEQTGLDEPFHQPDETFTQCVVNWVAGQRRMVGVLGAHNHLNMRVEHAGVSYVTTSALVEAPFEFKVFKLDSGRFSMETVSLASDLSFQAAYNHDKAFVQGREFERTHEIDLPCSVSPAES